MEQEASKRGLPELRAWEERLSRAVALHASLCEQEMMAYIRSATRASGAKGFARAPRLGTDALERYRSKIPAYDFGKHKRIDGGLLDPTCATTASTAKEM